MKAYLDSSVLLRIVFGEPDPLPASNRLSGVTSALTAVEAARALDRETLLADILRRVDTIEIDRASQPPNERPLQLARAARAMHFEVPGA